MVNKDNVQILFENDDVLVVNKPAGLVVHSDGKTKESTLVDWILERYPEIKGVGEPEGGRDGIVHRLDRDTSGVLVVAKNQNAFEFLKSQFKEREVRKMYRAFVYGKVKNDEGAIDVPIGKSKKDFRMYSAQRGARGELREAVTKYKVLARFEKEGKDFSYLELYPQTGRTHQIRVHLKYLNHPIVGDTLYGGKRVEEKDLGFDCQALHSYLLEITLPDGERQEFEAPLPKEFERATV